MPFYKCTTCGAVSQKLRRDVLPGKAPPWWDMCPEPGCEDGVTEYYSESPRIKLKKGDTGNGPTL